MRVKVNRKMIVHGVGGVKVGDIITVTEAVGQELLFHKWATAVPEAKAATPEPESKAPTKKAGKK